MSGLERARLGKEIGCPGGRLVMRFAATLGSDDLGRNDYWLRSGVSIPVRLRQISRTRNRLWLGLEFPGFLGHAKTAGRNRRAAECPSDGGAASVN